MNNEIDITKLKLRLCSQCPFVCKGQVYCTRQNYLMMEDVKQVNSINELEKRNV